MASISSRNLVDAVLRVEAMNFQERDRLADEVHARQPNLFYSVLVLQRYGATLVQIEVVLNLLLVFHEAMKSSGSDWPVVSEEGPARNVSPAQRHTGEDVAILAARHELFLKARELSPARRSGATRDWSPVGPVTLNPERESVVADYAQAPNKQPLAA